MNVYECKDIMEDAFVHIRMVDLCVKLSNLYGN